MCSGPLGHVQFYTMTCAVLCGVLRRFNLWHVQAYLIYVQIKAWLCFAQETMSLSSLHVFGERYARDLHSASAAMTHVSEHMKVLEHKKKDREETSETLLL